MLWLKNYKKFTPKMVKNIFLILFVFFYLLGILSSIEITELYFSYNTYLTLGSLFLVLYIVSQVLSVFLLVRNDKTKI